MSISDICRFSVCTRETPPVELLATNSKQAAFAFATTSEDVWDWRSGEVITE